jgi:trans-2,3-dihydro-3-hydroxyanthranilate isomerase
MSRRYVTVDVFTDRRFGGNPLAVVLDAEGLATAEMQQIAAEFNYSETTFVLPPADPRHTVQVRIFTPRSEMPFAGHPNVGTAFVLAREGTALQGDFPGFRFEEAAGLVPVTLQRDGDTVAGAELRAPQALTRGPSVAVDQVARCLSIPVDEIVTAAHEPCVASVGLPFVVVQVASRDVLAHTRADAAAHEALFPLQGADGVFAYFREPHPERTATLHARMFAPVGGVPEDPATGSATAAAVALLASLDPKIRGERRWSVHQGADMGRPSLLCARTIHGDAGLESVHVGGRCVVIMEGMLV